MHALHTACLALAAALAATYATLALTERSNRPQPITRPPLLFQEQDGELKVWGAWEMVKGDSTYDVRAVEIRCFKAQGKCISAKALVLNHVKGQDVEAQADLFTISEWTAQRLEAKAGPVKDDCSEWSLALYPTDRSGKLNWKGSDGCEVEPGEAVLVGDE
ncbi:hypothetical protein QYE80_15755 [Pseudomonas tohonis]|nr:hypothetical protein [Pseudomonas tohonis]